MSIANTEVIVLLETQLIKGVFQNNTTLKFTGVPTYWFPTCLLSFSQKLECLPYDFWGLSFGGYQIKIIHKL